MKVMDLKEVRDLALSHARARGHDVRWSTNGRQRYTTRCKKCGATMIAYRQMTDAPLPDDYDLNEHIVARDRDLASTNLDYNWAEGPALTTWCR